jgi:hypothetical protein
MGLFNWFRGIFGSRKTAETVPFYDARNRRVVRIPATELRPGVVQVRLAGQQDLVWVLPGDLHAGAARHPPFGEDLRKHIRQIKADFAEHRPLTLDEWEAGFRRDANPEREIALWSHAADVYRAFASQASSLERRQDVYRVIVACLTTSPDSVGRVLEPKVLTRAEAESIVKRFFGSGKA